MVSSVVLALFQEDSIETSKERRIRVLKGREGTIGEFPVRWDFYGMNFDQVEDSTTGMESQKPQIYSYID